MNRLLGGPRRRRSLAVAVIALSTAFAVFGGWVYLDARSDSSLAYAASRDAALRAGRTQVAALSTLDAAHPGATLTSWLDASTGPLHDELRRTGTGKPTTSARGEVTEAAVTELDDRSGSAKLIATVRVRLTPKGGAATTDRKRFEAALERTGSGWKLKALNAVPVAAP
ncbi:hypothetical protein [Streptomyces sp. NBC_00083]|uniref:hypothetical protein n=1 Tax=Streptomyces sp. NBC_00083 TaxID=2975647 RepID=UPI002258F989|nr:hypothetical protein [Streptomyces sp. NBC_00083]MCX5386711.1 hypothetical protein [Streptomyces sp. NBC_00083]